MARILIIEDDAAVRALIAETLGEAGHEVVEAGEGGVGLRLYRAAPADLVITDLLMPGKEGIETIIELRREFPSAKVVAMSGGYRYGSEANLRSAGLAGADRVISKPFGIAELLAAVREVLAVEPD